MSIRSTAKAIIIHNNKVLLNRCFDDNNGEYYSLPGGGQNTYETIHEAIIRECLEETGYDVIPLRFSALCEEICDDPKIAELHPEYIHKMYHIFICGLKSEDRVKAIEMDQAQIESEWIDIGNLNSIKLVPSFLNDNIITMINTDIPMFLGSEHIAHNHG